MKVRRSPDRRRAWYVKLARPRVARRQVGLTTDNTALPAW